MQILTKSMMVFMLLLCCAATNAQQAPDMKTLSLDDLSEFKPQAGNWRIVGDVTMNPSVDVHHQVPAAPAEKSKKSKKQKTPPAQPPQAVISKEGKGVLLNINDETRKDQLVTTWEHGDIDLELEVMLPKGSNSGLYLQGRYEVQLFDSWGIKHPKFSDIGGIYRNWEKEPGKIYMGKAPLSNPAKAPGLWQTLKISFRAPKFDASGKKVANARFTSVELNGVKIHDNIEVPLPTGGPIENNEKATGPIVIQGDHGPVAFRNIRYRLMKETNFSIGDVKYEIHHGTFQGLSDFTSAKPALSGTSKTLTCEVLDVENQYGVVYKGNITVPESGNYLFRVLYTGNGKLVINGQESKQGSGRNDLTLNLQAGTYPFEIYNYKNESWMPPRLALFVQSSGTYPQALHAFNSFPPDEDPVSSIYLNPGSEPRLLRAFLDFKGQRSQRLTHTLGVGDPIGTHYIYDLKAGNIACVWRGNFVDATPMWHDRGDGSFRPRGAAQYLFMGQALAYLTSENEAFPPTPKEGELQTKGYVIEEATGRPVFRYLYQDLEIEDHVSPDDEGRMITREIVLKKAGTKPGLYVKLGEGRSITEMPDGSFAMDDKQYYIKVHTVQKPTIRESNGKKELILPVGGTTVKYSIIW